jgi:hypothetical protein
VIWSVFEKVAQSNSRFNALDKLVIDVYSVKMPIGFGKTALKTKGRTLSVMTHLKKSIVEVQAEEYCLAHAIVIAIAKVTNVPNYKAYIKGRKIIPAVQNLLETTGINLDNGGGIPELIKFQEHFKEYRIVVYEGMNCDQILFDGQNEEPKCLNLLFDDVTRHYHVINNLTCAMAKQYVCKACSKGCQRGITHVCDQTCSDCMSSPSCVPSGVRVPCDECNRHFRSQTCFDKHKNKQSGGGRQKKSVC